MKQTILTLTLALIGLSTSFAQVGIGTPDPDASAMLDVDSPDKGFLPPRMETPPTDPATGLIIYNTIENCLQVNVGTPTTPDWQCFDGSGAASGGGSSSGGDGGAFSGPIFSNLRFIPGSLRTSFGTSSATASAIAANNDLYMWGRSSNKVINQFPGDGSGSTVVPFGSTGGYHTPNNMSDLFAPFKNNVAEVALTENSVAVRTLDNKLYTWGTNIELGIGSSSGTTFAPAEIAGNWVKLMKTSSDVNGPYIVAIDNQGRAFYTGTVGAVNRTTFTQIPFPSGVPAGFTYTKSFHAGNRHYLYGSNNKLYVAGGRITVFNGLGTGVVLTPGNSINLSPLVQADILEVNTDADMGTPVHIEGNNYFVSIIDDKGDLYLCGIVKVGSTPAYAAVFDGSLVDRTNSTQSIFDSFKKVQQINGTIPFKVAQNVKISDVDTYYLGTDGEFYVSGIVSIIQELGGIKLHKEVATGSIASQAFDTQGLSYESLLISEAVDVKFIDFRAVSVSAGNSEIAFILMDEQGRLWGYNINHYGITGQSISTGRTYVPTPFKNGNYDASNRAPEPQ